MKKKIFITTDSMAPAILRIILGLVVFPHGAQKLFGWFGGYGFEGTMKYFTETVGMPWIVGFLVIMLEVFGAIALITGFCTRVVAGAYLVLATGIIFSTDLKARFFMNWFGNQPGEGYEYFLLWMGMAAALTLNGAGKYSIDRLFVSGHKF